MQLIPRGGNQYTVSLDSKDITLGNSPLQQQQNSVGGFFAFTTGVDPYRYPGMICPGPLPVASTGQAISGTPFSLQFLDNGKLGTWLMTSTGIYNMSYTAVVQSINANPLFTGLASHTLAGVTVTQNHSIIKLSDFNANATIGGSGFNGGAEMFYFTDGAIGYFVNSTTAFGSGFNDTFFSSGIASGVPHRAVIFNKRVYFTNGTTIGYVDISSGNPASYTIVTSVGSGAFQLPIPSIAKDIRIENDMLSIYCDTSGGGGTDSGKTSIVIWDGVSGDLATDIISLDDNLMLGAEQVNGFPIVVTKGRGAGSSIRKKNYWGYPSVQFLNSSNMATADVNPGLMSTLSSSLLIGSNLDKKIFAYGTPFETYSYRGTDSTGTFPEALVSPFATTGTTVKSFSPAVGNVLAASLTSSTPTLEYFPIANYSNYNNPTASFQTNFIPLPGKCVIDSVTFYVLPITTGAKFTPTLFTDFATSATWTAPDDIASTNLDSDINAKTYVDMGNFATCFAIGGNWASSSINSAAVVIYKIDVNVTRQ